MKLRCQRLHRHTPKPHPPSPCAHGKYKWQWFEMTAQQKPTNLIDFNRPPSSSSSPSAIHHIQFTISQNNWSYFIYTWYEVAAKTHIVTSHRQWRVPCFSIAIHYSPYDSVLFRHMFIEYKGFRCSNTDVYTDIACCCIHKHKHVSVSERWRCQFETLITFSFNIMRDATWPVVTICSCILPPPQPQPNKRLSANIIVISSLSYIDRSERQHNYMRRTSKCFTIMAFILLFYSSPTGIFKV